MNVKVIGGRTKMELKSISTAPGNAPLSRGRKINSKPRREVVPIEDNERYKKKVQQENQEISRQKCINTFIATEDPAGLKTFLRKLYSVYKKCFIKDTFKYAEKKVVDSGFPDDTKKEILEIIHKLI